MFRTVSSRAAWKMFPFMVSFGPQTLSGYAFWPACEHASVPEYDVYTRRALSFLFILQPSRTALFARQSSFIVIRCDVLLINHGIKPHTISSNSWPRSIMIITVAVIIFVT